MTLHWECQNKNDKWELVPKISTDIVRDNLFALDEFKLPGPDELHPLMLKK